jgi:hypothetical protein
MRYCLYHMGAAASRSGAGLATTSVRRKRRSDDAASISMQRVGAPTQMPAYNECTTGLPEGARASSAADREMRSSHAMSSGEPTELLERQRGDGALRGRRKD